MSKKIAFLSAEFSVTPDLPIFAGGLGVLAGDILYQAGDLDLPLVGITLFHQEGCFNQRVDTRGVIREEFLKFNPATAGLQDTGVAVDVPFPDRIIRLKVWKQLVGKVPLYLLDTDVPENNEVDRKMAYRLYDGRVWPPRIERDLLLGVGGVRALRKLEKDVSLWHINDDHTAFSLFERIKERTARGESLSVARGRVKKETVYTTHTPSLAAESVFDLDEAVAALAPLFGGDCAAADELCALGERNINGRKRFSLTVFAMKHSRSVNAVSRAHKKVSREMWSFVWPPTSQGEVPITYVTNGVYPKRWVAVPMASLYERHLASDWSKKTDSPALWKKVEAISDEDFWQARFKAKEALAVEVLRRTGKSVDPQALILAFARRFVKYKQPTLLISDIERLASILCDAKRPVYLLMAGKAHPDDERAKDLVRQVAVAANHPILKDHLIFLENYGLDLAHPLVSGCDVWLNTPVPGHEASGTSGMKAVFNGVLHASVLDGWWVEAFDGKNGWEVKGPGFAASLYSLLEKEIVPLFYRQEDGVPKEWLEKVKHSISNLAPRFTTARMMKEYKEKIYNL